MNFEQEALEFIRRLQTLYFEQRDLSALLFAMNENISWIGTGAQELCRNLEDAKATLSLEAQECADRFTVAASHYDVIRLSEDVCVIYGTLTAKPEDVSLADVHNRMTAVCVRNQDEIKLAHLHMSTPDADQEDGSFYVKRNEAGQRETLRLRAEKNARELHRRNSELEALTENIPGGVHQCECDDGMTFINMSNSFLALTGYSRREIQERFHNRFAEMIYPEDLVRVRTEIKEQLSHGDTLELEYRIVRSDGRQLWISDHSKCATLRDGSRCFYCMIIDITKQREEHEKLRLLLEQHQIIMDQTTDIIFEWDIRRDRLTFSSNWRKKFGYEPIREQISRKIPQSRNIHQEDMPAFLKIMGDTADGVPYSEAEFRIRDIWDNFTWSRIRATTQYDLHRQPVKAVGVICDIDVEKKQKQRLLEQAQRDSLTNLYNKTAVREFVERRIQEGGEGEYQALLMIDVDNFKHVNDTYGHLCGDSLLSDVARVLKSHFRADDIVGRIGGDEFLVYLSGIAGKKQVELKAAEVLNALRLLRPMKTAPPITCSIGIAVSLQKASGYFELYQCADMALYHIKAQGRNNFAVYDPKVCKGQTPGSLSKSAIGAIDSEAMLSDAVGQQLIQYTFQMLYDSIDVKTAVGHLLEIVGRAYDVSRVYIFESTEDGKRCNNTFEWCNTGVPSEMDHLQNIDYMEDLGDYMQNFNDNHIFYCRDISELHPDLYNILAPQGICSMLQCAIMDDGMFRGYVGFDECRESRSWTKEQVGSLTMIANVLSTFLLKERLKERLSGSV